jgi:hypothetical protein
MNKLEKKILDYIFGTLKRDLKNALKKKPVEPELVTDKTEIERIKKSKELKH